VFGRGSRPRMTSRSPSAAAEGSGKSRKTGDDCGQRTSEAPKPDRGFIYAVYFSIHRNIA
jgi:hypothetical protein